MKKFLMAGLVMGFGLVACDQAAEAPSAKFTEDGQLMRPDPTTWVFVSSSATDTASEQEALGAEAKSEGKANIIHIDPKAWAHFNETGGFPEGTMFTMSFYSMHDKDMGRPRLWADQQTGVEVGVKDSKRFSDGWGFFRFTGDEQTAEVFPRESCFECHEAMGETDHVFTQLYAIFNKDK